MSSQLAAAGHICRSCLRSSSATSSLSATSSPIASSSRVVLATGSSNLSGRRYQSSSSRSPAAWRTSSASTPAARRHQSSWSTVVETARNLVSPAGNTPPKPDSSASSSSTSSPLPLIRDPLDLVSRELTSLRSNVSTLLGSGHPSLDTIAKYYFQADGKHVRPLIVLLIAKATNGLSPLFSELSAAAERDRADGRASLESEEGAKFVEDKMGIDEPLSPREVLNDFNPHMEGIEGAASVGAATAAASEAVKGLAGAAPQDSKHAAINLVAGESSIPILPTQRRLAEITEMIHVASLLHDDVIDASELRRGQPSAPAAFGNKLSILGGDFLLGRASVALARLRDNEVVELLATVIANLVEGEVMQLRSQTQNGGAGGAGGDKPTKSQFSTFWEGDPTGASESAQSSQPSSAAENAEASGPTPEMFEHYLQKTYLKTAALIGKSARASAILGGCGSDAVKRLSLTSSPLESSVEVERRLKEVRDAAYQYGRNVGIAFQLVDDLLDFKSTSEAFGKPSGGADLRLGLATAPVLYAWQEKPGSGIGEMVRRKFEGEGDVEKALAIVNSSQGLERTATLARHYAALASKALEVFPPSEARDALEKLNGQVLSRIK